MNYDPYLNLAAREMAEERAIDLNRETAPEMDGISPDNVPVWTLYRVENNDGTTNPNATANALCARIQELEEENDNLRAGMRNERADNEAAWKVADEMQASLELAHANVTRWAELYRNAVQPKLLDHTSFGRQRIMHDIAFGNPDASEQPLKNVA